MTGDTVQSNFKGLRSTRWRTPRRRIFSERKQDEQEEREKGVGKRGIYATNRNLPEVPLYSLLSSLSSSLDLPIRLSAAFPRE